MRPRNPRAVIPFPPAPPSRRDGGRVAMPIPNDLAAMEPNPTFEGEVARVRFMGLCHQNEEVDLDNKIAYRYDVCRIFGFSTPSSPSSAFGSDL